MQLETARLLIRPWQDSDRTSFADMSADPEAMKYLGGIWDKATSDGFIDRCLAHLSSHGFGVCALQLKKQNTLIGFAGLKRVSFEAAFTPAIEIGWRLATPYWNKGYATEAATASLTHAFHQLQISEVISYATPQNTASIKVMKKIGMRSNADENFKHPNMNPDDPMSEMVLYRVKRSD